MSGDNDTRRRQLLAAYGADAARWPAGERHLWQATDPGERAETADAGRIDALLDMVEPPPPPPGAKARLMARLAAQTNVAKTASPAVADDWRWRPVAAGLALAASLAVGMVVGVTGAADEIVASAVSAVSPTVAESNDDTTDPLGFLAGVGDGAGEGEG